MTTSEMTPEEIQGEISKEIAEFLFYLHENFKTHPKEMVTALTTSLGAYIAVVAREPAKALASAANVLAQTDFVEVRRQHFSYTLGAHSTQKPKIVLAPPADPKP